MAAAAQCQMVQNVLVHEFDVGVPKPNWSIIVSAKRKRKKENVLWIMVYLNPKVNSGSHLLYDTKLNKQCRAPVFQHPRVGCASPNPKSGLALESTVALSPALAVANMPILVNLFTNATQNSQLRVSVWGSTVCHSHSKSNPLKKWDLVYFRPLKWPTIASLWQQKNEFSDFAVFSPFLTTIN